MPADVRFEATVICGRPGCPWQIHVHAPTQSDATSGLTYALAEHKRVEHGPREDS